MERGMKRIKLTVAYDGTHYSGWQIQPNAPTIEKELDTAIYTLTGEKLHVTGASRTDAGVHGLGNVAVFDTESTIPGSRFCYALNRYLPEEISILPRFRFHSSAITHGTYRENWTLSVCGKRRNCLSGNTILKASAV